ncbi:MAG: urease accessory protein UreF, partial [Starkeya sp.]|nr:urease accessory protein UreF [Starkeya sp.]
VWASATRPCRRRRICRPIWARSCASTRMTLAAVQGLLWQASGLDEASAALLAGYQLVAGGLTAATRLGLIGALGAQQLMPDLLATLAALCAEPVAADAEPAGFSPFSDIAAARQARLPLRLFSN